MDAFDLSLTALHQWLEQDDPCRLEELWAAADAARVAAVGDEVYFRGLVEISNYCSRACLYCGLRSARKISRYRMTDDEILAAAQAVRAAGIGTVVLQAGEDPGLDARRVYDLIRRIKRETNLVVTLSLGEQSEPVFRLWKEAGADRYLLRVETTDDELLRWIHPAEPNGSRKANILRLRDLGYQVGSGIMVGIPGQTYTSVAHDLEWFKEMDLDMIGIGPYLPHPETPLAKAPQVQNQVPNSELMTHKVLALTRLLCPEANIPATTALSTLNQGNGRELALERGANVIMPNVTPVNYRAMYEIYPNKSCVFESDPTFLSELTQAVKKMGRHVGTGPGHRHHGK